MTPPVGVFCHDPELEKAVALCKSDTPVALKKHEQYEQIRKFANRQRLPTETIEQATSRFITKDPDGRVLYKAFTQAKGASFAPSAQSGSDADGDNDAPGESEHMKAIRLLVAALMAKDPTLTKASAMSKIIQTPSGATLYLADRRARTRVT